MDDYDRIARIIHYLDAHHLDQPDLATLAAHAGLSAYHFHRLFAAWAGVTPKDFLQCLTVRHAKALLREGESVTGAALEAGLTGPGRLHDLCVSLEAASPGEWKSGGAGWTISAGWAESPFGACLIGAGPRGVCHLAFADPGGTAAAWRALQEDWPRARLERDDDAAVQLAGRIFAPPTATAQPPLRALVRGTAFQVRVWRALMRVRPGTLVSYSHVAAAIGQPGAYRAVGSAIARNALAYLIPCHRVICETGIVGQYRWGRTRKQAMLAREAALRHAARYHFG